MATPFFLLFFLFTVVPVLGSVVISLTSFDMLQLPKFVGVDNYIRLFLNDDVFLKALSNTFIFAVIIGPLGYIFSFLFAWLLNEVNRKVRTVLTLCFYAPSISGNMVVVWQYFFSGDSQGYLNSVLYQLGISSTPTLWLKNPETLFPIICFVSLWASLGTSFLVFIAGLQGVDRSYYEASAIDGIKNRWQELWYVTLPVMKPQLLFGVVMSISGAFSIHDVTVALAGYPSTDNTATTIVNLMADVGYQRFELGYASAMATVLFLMMIVARQLFNKLLDRVGK